MKKRQNKSKKEIVADIKQVQNAERMRELVRKDIYPFLLQLNNTIGYSKIFLQTSATALDSAYTARQRDTKVSEFIEDLKKVFVAQDPKQQAEMDKYIQFFELLKNESLHDFQSMVATLPRVIDSYFTHEKDKAPILDLDVNKILG